MHRLKRRIEKENLVNGVPVLRQLKPHRLAVFAVDNIDTTNQHGITVHGKTDHGPHMTGIQGVFFLKEEAETEVRFDFS